METLRRSFIPLHLFGNLAVAASVATFTVPRSLVLSRAQLSLPGSGTGAGGTTVDVKVNGIAVITAITVASAAANPTATQLASPSAGTYPSGWRLNAGDVVTVDVTAVPGTTVPPGGVVYLDVVQVDVA